MNIVGEWFVLEGANNLATQVFLWLILLVLFIIAVRLRKIRSTLEWQSTNTFVAAAGTDWIIVFSYVGKQWDTEKDDGFYDCPDQDFPLDIHFFPVTGWYTDTNSYSPMVVTYPYQEYVDQSVRSKFYKYRDGRFKTDKFLLIDGVLLDPDPNPLSGEGVLASLEDKLKEYLRDGWTFRVLGATPGKYKILVDGFVIQSQRKNDGFFEHNFEIIEDDQNDLEF